jgi:hypothetical protein
MQQHCQITAAKTPSLAVKRMAQFDTLLAKKT